MHDNNNLGVLFSNMGKTLLENGVLKDNAFLNNKLKAFAQKIFYEGHISVESMGKTKKIYIFDVEFYCHQEGKGRDSKMYHTNDQINIAQKDSFAFEYKASGFPFIHQSGMDIVIFEYEKNGIRLTMLIRGVLILKEGDMSAEKVRLHEKDYYKEIKGLVYRIETRPTFIIGQILSGSIFYDGGITIKWVTEDIPYEIREFSSFKETPEPSLRKNLEKSDRADKKEWRFSYLDVKGDKII